MDEPLKARNEAIYAKIASEGEYQVLKGSFYFTVAYTDPVDTLAQVLRGTGALITECGMDFFSAETRLEISRNARSPVLSGVFACES